MARVICDTSFLVHLATKRIKNISTFETEIGPLQFVVPTVVITELSRLQNDPQKKKPIAAAIEYSKKLDTIRIGGQYADQAILQYVAKNKGLVATLDKGLKLKIKSLGGSVISLRNDRIVLEP